MSNENQVDEKALDTAANEGMTEGNDAANSNAAPSESSTETGTSESSPDAATDSPAPAGNGDNVGEQAATTSTDVDASVAAENLSAAASTVSESEKPTYDQLIEQAKAFLEACQSVGCDAVALLKETAGVA